MTATHIPNVESKKEFWPWQKLPELDEVPSGPVSSFPRITIITPSYNQGQFLEETIRSVLLQGYPNLEYMVIDGGSTDNSVEIIKKYEPWIDYWVSEPDRGQAHAINKGFVRCTGELVGWINSDDMLLPGALHKLATAYLNQPDRILLGDVINFNNGGGKRKLIRQKNVSFNTMVLAFQPNISWHQPGIYVPSKLFFNDHIFLDDTFRYVFDQDWMCRLLRSAKVFYLNEPVALFRKHPNSKTMMERTKWLPEVEVVVKRYWDEVPGLNMKKVAAILELNHAAILLGRTNWDRSSAYEHIKNAIQLYPQCSFSPQCIELFMRYLLPRPFLMWLRSKLAKLNIRFTD